MKRALAWLVRNRLFVLLAFTYAYFFQGGDPNQATRFLLTKSIAVRSEPHITPWHYVTLDKGYKDGKFYSDKAPLVSLASVPVYAGMDRLDRAFGIDGSSRPVERAKLHFLVFLFAGLPTVFTAWFLHRSLLLLRCPARLAGVLAFGFGVGTIALPFATVMFGHTLSGAFIAATLWLVLRWRLEDSLQGDVDAPLLVTPVRSLTLGALWSLAVVTEYPTAMIAAPIGLYFVMTPRFEGRSFGKALAWGALGAAPAFVAHAIFVKWAFGSFAALPYNYVADPVFRSHTTSGVLGIGLPSLKATYGVLVSPYRGIFFLSPFLALVFVGIASWVRSRDLRREAWMCIGAIGIYGWFACSYYAWDGGGSTGPRHLVPVLPFVIIAISWFARERRSAAITAYALIAVSVIIVTLTTSVLVQMPEGAAFRSNPLHEVVLPALARGELASNFQDVFYPRPQRDVAYNLGVLFGLSPRASLAFLVLVWCAAFVPSLFEKNDEVPA